MSLYAAIVELQEGPDRQRAARELRAALGSVGLRRGAIDAFHADAVQGALLKLLEGARPTRTSDAAVRSFLGVMVKNRQVDLARRAGRYVPTDVPPEPPPGTPATDEPEPDLDELDRRSRELLRLAFAHALEQRSSRYRPTLEQSWRELQALMDGVTVQELLGQQLGLPPDSPEWTRAVYRMHTAHKRAREALADATEALIAAGKISSEDASLARANLSRLRTRQQAAAGASTGEQT